jgi:general L-amino acid transport system substrate-binding protein
MRLTKLLLICAGFSFISAPLLSKTLEDVQKRGYLQCGVSSGLPGFSFPAGDGKWNGLDVDICRAVAAAIFGDSTKVRFTPLSTKERFAALQSGEIEILSRNSTWTISREAGMGLEFTNIVFYDDQAFMVPKASGISSVKQLAGATICTNAGTTNELSAADYFNERNIQYHIITFEKANEVLAAYSSGRCDAYTTDRSGLYSQLLKLENPNDHKILDETIAKEPLGPAVRQDDIKWITLVRWVINGLVYAEEKDVTKSNVKAMLNNSPKSVQRLLGKEQNFGAMLGLKPDFMVNVISQLGNYGEIYDRNFGSKSRLHIPRGLNNLWKKGGLMYSPPFR